VSKKPVDPASGLLDISIQRRTLLQRSLLGGATVVAGTLIGGLASRWTYAADPSPVVDTTGGRVRGAAINGVQTFKGIHYGA
jgi:hypothetical protein